MTDLPLPDEIPGLLDHLIALYGAAAGRAICDRVKYLVGRYRSLISSPPVTGLRQRDAILITYGDQVREPGVLPLRTLTKFCESRLKGLVSGIHILPFYPSSWDDGFSVIDYKAVDPALGAWEDVMSLHPDFRLMLDAVVNHISAKSKGFQGFLGDDPTYRDYFIVVRDGADLSDVVRPRPTPPTTWFATPCCEKAVWTTFSADQIDLNYANPEVLLEVLETLLFYAAHKAAFIRLDAIAYLWKEIGTDCIHLPQTHRVIQLFRTVLNAVTPHVALITETNVPHADNIAYFGDGTNEAQLVYNFALPPLVLHAFQTGEASKLSRWADGLSLPSDQVTFFNFLASHDGIGLNPVRDILSEAEIGALVDGTLKRGGSVSYKRNADGTQSPYELNINYLDALVNPGGEGEGLELLVDRFMAAQAIMLALVGLPGIYFHSLFGSRGWPEGVELTKSNRTINRQKCERPYLEEELSDPESLRYKIFRRYTQLLKARAASAAFHPHGRQRVIQAQGRQAVFAVWRTGRSGDEQVLCLHNVSGQPQQIEVDKQTAFQDKVTSLTDLVGEGLQPTLGDKTFKIALKPYQVRWLRTA